MSTDSNGIKFESKEAVMAFYGVTLAADGELDYTACSNMAAFTTAFITACTAEIEAKRPAIMAKMEKDRQYAAEMVAGVARALSARRAANIAMREATVALSAVAEIESNIALNGEWLPAADVAALKASLKTARAAMEAAQDEALPIVKAAEDAAMIASLHARNPAGVRRWERAAARITHDAYTVGL